MTNTDTIEAESAVKGELPPGASEASDQEKQQFFLVAWTLNATRRAKRGVLAAGRGARTGFKTFLRFLPLLIGIAVAITAAYVLVKATWVMLSSLWLASPILFLAYCAVTIGGSLASVAAMAKIAHSMNQAYEEAYA
jgi:hypothetical protein